MTERNRFGLSRNIPRDVQRQVRQQSGFGCVVCGNLLYTYEHIDPTFNDAHKHDPERITLLCWSCHDRVSRGIWTKDKIWKKKHFPYNLTRGYTNDFLDVCTDDFDIIVGTNKFLGCEAVVIIRRYPIIWFEAPETDGGPIRINAWFFDKDNNLIAEIIRNEFRASVRNWDVKATGTDVFIYNESRDCGLHMVREGGRSIRIVKLNMCYQGYKLYTKGDALHIIFPSGTDMPIRNSTFQNCAMFISTEVPACKVDPIVNVEDYILNMHGEIIGLVAGSYIMSSASELVGTVTADGHVYRVTGEYVGKKCGCRIVKGDDLDPDGRAIFVLRTKGKWSSIVTDGKPDACDKILGPWAAPGALVLADSRSGVR